MADNITPGASHYTVKAGFLPEVLDILRDTIGSKLRREELEPLERARDEALRTMDRDVKDPFAFFLEHAARYELGCQEVLRCAKPVLYEAINKMLEELEPKLLSPENMGARPQPIRDDANEVSKLSSSNIPLATTHTQSRSPSLEQEVDSNAGHSSLTNTAPVAPSVTEAGSPVDPFQSGRKRPAPPQDDERSCIPGKKRSKKASVHDRPKIKRQIPFAKADECVFMYRDYAGFYVLRCDKMACKKRAGVASSDPFYFRRHPFGDSTALKHFDTGHRIKDKNDKDELFLKYAVKVTDAMEERNLHGPERSSDKQPTPIYTRRAQTPSPLLQAQQQPLSPLSITRDIKGNQPERVASGRYLLSPVAIQKEVFDRDDTKSQTAVGDDRNGSHTPTTSGASRTIAAAITRHPFDSGSESDSLKEIPSVEHFRNGTRWKTRIDYREKPPLVGEFD